MGEADVKYANLYICEYISMMTAKQIILLLNNVMNLLFHLCLVVANEVQNIEENTSFKVLPCPSKIMTFAYTGVTELSVILSNRLFKSYSCP